MHRKFCQRQNKIRAKEQEKNQCTDNAASRARQDTTADGSTKDPYRVDNDTDLCEPAERGPQAGTEYAKKKNNDKRRKVEHITQDTKGVLSWGATSRERAP